MRDGEYQDKRRELIDKNPGGYLESVLKALKFYSSADLVDKLYSLKSFGSECGQECLDPATDAEKLLATIPLSVLLQILSLEERHNIKLTLITLGFSDFMNKPAADVIIEIEAKLEQLKK